MNDFKAWWKRLVAPANVERELAWRGYVLNTLLLGLMALAVLFFVMDLVYWLQGQDNGSVVVALAVLLCVSFLFWLSRNKSIRLAILLFSILNVSICFILSLGWGVSDIATTAFYVMAIIQTSILLRGKRFVVVLGVLLFAYFGFGLAELNGYFAPPFYTDLKANHISVTALLFFLTFLGYVTSRLIDQVLAAQVDEAARRQELESRTKIAAEVQMSMLPDHPPRYDGFDIVGQSIPARDVGGDFYDYHQLASGQLGIIIGDVTGKGMSAALLMAVTVGMIDGLIPAAAEPTDLLMVTAARLRRHSRRSGLNTACLVAFLQPNGALCVANAGCIAPVILRANGQLGWLNVYGLPMGVENEFPRYEQVSAILNSGDMVIFTTDGIVESQNADREILGFDRLESIIGSAPQHSAQATKDYILHQVQQFQSTLEYSDDMTVVVVRMKNDLSQAAIV